MSIFLGALGGMGEQMSSMGSTLMKAELDRTAKAEDRAASAKDRLQESDLALERAKALEEFKSGQQNAPLLRLSGKAKELAGQEVPVEAKPVSKLSGNVPEGDGTRGFVGDPGIVQRAIANLPEKDRAAAMAQFQRQMSGDQEVEQQAVAGKTRKRTSDEALEAAVDDAKVNDLPAYAAYEKDIGKPRRDERRVANQETREENRYQQTQTAEERRALADARRYDAELKRLDLQAGTLEATNRKIDAWIDNEATKRTNDENKANNPKASTPERLYSIVNAMNASIKQLQDGGNGNTPEAKAEWQRQYETAVRVRDRASALLDTDLGERGAAPASATPAPSQPPKAAAPAKAAPAIPAPMDMTQRKAGTVYSTPKGPMTWTGTGWLPAN